MERKKTFTMNWAGLGDVDDDDHFFETVDQASSGSDDDEEFEDPRSSFASVLTSASTTEFRNYGAAPSVSATMLPDYDIWMAAPGSINERRKRLFQGMGLSADKEVVGIVSKDQTAPVSDKMANEDVVPDVKDDDHVEESKQEAPPSPVKVLLSRSRSGSHIVSFSAEKKRKEELFGNTSKQRLTKTSSMIIVSHNRICPYQDSIRASSEGRITGQEDGLAPVLSNDKFGAFFLIKNLDTGNEFVVNEYKQDGMWNRVSDLQTGKQLTIEEFEQSVGDSPVVKELMKRDVSKRNDEFNSDDKKITPNSYISKSLKISKRRGAALLKNIKVVAHSMSITGSRGTDKEKEVHSPVAESKGGGKNSPSSGWIKVRQTGKSHKELSALHLCQEIQAHEGSIWTIKFSPDAKFLASGGEDRTIHIWEVQECEVMSFNDGNLSQLHSFSTTSGTGETTALPSEKKKKKKGSSSRKSNPIPEYVHVSDTVFSLSDKPVCSFTGHLDDVLDLSWSKSQQLLSSSMDKTVRLWDMETKNCIKMFAHNDYVTCIQFNPVNDNYFISGSLDNKIRVWNIPDRQLVDWIDLHEMVTAVCYTPDGQGALIGSHKGSCRLYNVEDCKLNQAEQIDLQNKKRPKKITGFQFSPSNPSEVLVTSADSRIRILDGPDLVHKFRGFRNLNSQIAASYSACGKHVICASEDSQVFVWKREEKSSSSSGAGKGKTVMHTRSHESFQCRDVSMAIPWPGTIKGDPPLVKVHSKKHAKRSSVAQPPSPSCNSPTKEDASVSSKRHSSPTATESLPKEEEVSSAANGKRPLPPLPKKNKDKDNNNSNQESAPSPEDDPAAISQEDTGLGDSFNSSMRYGDSPSATLATPSASSSSRSSSWSWFDGGSHNQTQATAWGMVIVTATLGGEIRTYQNFGLPRRIGRQANLF